MNRYSAFLCYLRCDTCLSPMHGIRCPKARTTCHDCGGSALIGDSPVYREQVRLAQERTGSWEPPKRAPRPQGPRPIPPRAA